jgi:choline kinase
MEEFKVLITTSGLGSRLGDLTKYTNKSLVRVGKKPGISYIIENYPKDTKFVITLGHYGNQVRDFLTLAYNDRSFEFVEVDKYSGVGSSLGYSMLVAKDKLQCPFIFHASDTIVAENIPKPEYNWVIGNNKSHTSQYRLINNKGKFKIFDKGQLDDSNFCYIGLCGIKNYEKFWEVLENLYLNDPYSQELSDCDAINNMDKDFKILEFKTWFDVGSSSELKHARNNIGDKFEILDKVDESIFIFEDFVIKFFYDKNVCSNRVERCKYLNPLTPTLIDYRENFYKYEYSEGKLLSKAVNEELFLNFLNWSKENLWIIKSKNNEFKKKCEQFYFDKTMQRIERYLEQENDKDSASVINEVLVPSVKTLIELIDKDWLCSDQPYQYHGDYILDNIICKNKEEFVLLDWRQDFSGDLLNGDIYYDLAKLNHNLIFNHDIVNKKLYTIEKQDDKIHCDLMCSNNLINCQKILHSFLLANNFDLNKVEILTCIIWLNMAPLHEKPLNTFLFNFGKFNLYRKINEKHNI